MTQLSYTHQSPSYSWLSCDDIRWSMSWVLYISRIFQVFRLSLDFGPLFMGTATPDDLSLGLSDNEPCWDLSLEKEGTRADRAYPLCPWSSFNREQLMHQVVFWERMLVDRSSWWIQEFRMNPRKLTFHKPALSRERVIDDEKRIHD